MTRECLLPDPLVRLEHPLYSFLKISAPVGRCVLLQEAACPRRHGDVAARGPFLQITTEIGRLERALGGFNSRAPMYQIGELATAPVQSCERDCSLSVGSEVG